MATDVFDNLDERHDTQCEGDSGGRLACSCGRRQKRRVLTEMHTLRAAQARSAQIEAAARAVARTDHAALCYRDAALEGTFGFPEQTAAQAELDRQLGNLPY